MSSVENIGTTKHPIVVRFTRYLNGPMGKTVLENLEEGESFVLQTSEHTLNVTKKNGRAVVRLLSKSPSLSWELDSD